MNGMKGMKIMKGESNILLPLIFWMSILSPIFLVIWVVFIDFFSFVGIDRLTNDSFIIVDEVLRVSLFLGILVSGVYQIFFILNSNDRGLLEKKYLWIALIGFGNMFVIPVFSYLYLRKGGK